METKLATIAHVENKTFDYVIVGGGTAGLCLASRLSEDPQVTVLVLEAGESRFNDPLISTPASFAQQMGNPDYDWMQKTVPQKHLDNNVVFWNRGKGLGGSSNMNFLAWTRPSKQDIDAWERLGNPGWNWDNLVHYFAKSESFKQPNQEIIAREKLTIGPQWLGQGKDGVSVAYSQMSSGAEPTIRETVKALGIPTQDDPVHGKPIGSWSTPSSTDPITATRSTSATAYLLPNLDRSNLVVLTAAIVNRLLLEGGQGTEPVTATGVEFKHGEKTYQVQAKREAILCAGALKSSQIIELSGIGDRAILEPLGIDVKLDLPGVGTNVQEHICYMGLGFELRDDAPVQTFDSLFNPVEAEKQFKLYMEKRQGVLALTVSGLTFMPVQTFTSKSKSIIQKQLDKISKNPSGYSPALLEQYAIQAEHLQDPELHECELITNPIFSGTVNKAESGKRYMSFVVGLTAPWSRGTIHIDSKDPSAQPLLDPHYFEEEIDLELLTEAFKFARSLGEHEPFKSIVAKEANPGPAATSDAEIIAQFKGALNTIWHTTGPLSMLPREKGGVVDPSLKVWGTKNIRVVDLSIVPLQIGVHTQATTYAIAEKAADLIRGRA